MMTHPPAQRDILVIDDDPDIHAIVQFTLRTADGWRVRVAKTGKEGLRSAKESPPDIILLDVRMPEMDGPEVIRELQATPRTRHIPVIFLTGSQANEEEYAQIGASGLILKPFDRVELATTIEHFLRKLDDGPTLPAASAPPPEPPREPQ